MFYPIKILLFKFTLCHTSPLLPIEGLEDKNYHQRLKILRKMHDNEYMVADIWTNSGV